jgi:hypothetical protein
MKEEDGEGEGKSDGTAIVWRMGDSGLTSLSFFFFFLPVADHRTQKTSSHGMSMDDSLLLLQDGCRRPGVGV